MEHSGFFGVQRVFCNAAACIDVCSNTIASIFNCSSAPRINMCCPCCPMKATVPVSLTASLAGRVTVTMRGTGTGTGDWDWDCVMQAVTVPGIMIV